MDRMRYRRNGKVREGVDPSMLCRRGHRHRGSQRSARSLLRGQRPQRENVTNDLIL